MSVGGDTNGNEYVDRAELLAALESITDPRVELIGSGGSGLIITSPNDQWVTIGAAS